MNNRCVLTLTIITIFSASTTPTSSWLVNNTLGYIDTNIQSHQQQQQQLQNPTHFLIYNNTDISINYPDNWQIITPQPPDIAAFLNPQTQSSVGISQVDLPSGMTLDNLSQDILNYYSTAYPGLTPLVTSVGAAPMSLSGNPAHIITFAFNDNLGNQWVSVNIWTISDSKSYEIGYNAPANTFHFEKTVAQQMIGSFRINSNSEVINQNNDLLDNPLNMNVNNSTNSLFDHTQTSTNNSVTNTLSNPSVNELNEINDANIGGKTEVSNLCPPGYALGSQGKCINPCPMDYNINSTGICEKVLQKITPQDDLVQEQPIQSNQQVIDGGTKPQNSIQEDSLNIRQQIQLGQYALEHNRNLQNDFQSQLQNLQQDQDQGKDLSFSGKMMLMQLPQQLQQLQQQEQIIEQQIKNLSQSP